MSREDHLEYMNTQLWKLVYQLMDEINKCKSMKTEVEADARIEG